MSNFDIDRDSYEMTNLYPRHTGLPMTVRISPRGHTDDAARIKVDMSHRDRMAIDNTAIITLSPAPHLVAGELSRTDQDLVFAWVRLNQSALMDFWHDGDAYRLLPRLKPL